jgi:hypothetical protein
MVTKERLGGLEEMRGAGVELDAAGEVGGAVGMVALRGGGGTGATLLGR